MADVSYKRSAGELEGDQHALTLPSGRSVALKVSPNGEIRSGDEDVIAHLDVDPDWQRVKVPATPKGAGPDGIPTTTEGGATS